MGEPSAEALAVGRHLEEFPPPGFRGRYSAIGWAGIVDAVWAATNVVTGHRVELDDRPVDQREGSGR